MLLALILSTSPCGASVEVTVEEWSIKRYLGPTKVQPVYYQYELDDGRVLLSADKLKGVKDRRPWREKHPKVTHYALQFRKGCEYLLPIGQLGALLVVMFTS